MNWLIVFTWIITVLVTVPLLFFSLECFLALRRSRSRPIEPNPQLRTVVLIPAHNEGENIIPTLKSAFSQMGSQDRIVVVADNCTDNTAEIARQNGADVVERNDPERRGKGYALAFGRDSLRDQPPDIVLVLDADCLLGPDALPRLTTEAIRVGRPVQAAYYMTAAPDAGPNQSVASFAFLVKNYVRPLGLRRMGIPCLLMGTGMAFPWSVFHDAPLAHGNIVEDLGLAVDLAIGGFPPLFVSDAEVRGEFPSNDAAMATQRRRWEHGHLRVIREGVPRMLFSSLRYRRWELTAMALETGIPPLSSLILSTVCLCILLFCLGIFLHVWEPAITLSIAFAIAGFALAATWWQYGRNTIRLATMIHIPWYAIRKVGLYFDFLVRPQQSWVRTDRDVKSKPENPEQKIPLT